MYVVTPAGLEFVAEESVPYRKKRNLKKTRNDKGAIKSGKVPSNKLSEAPETGRYLDPKSDFGVKRLFGRRGCEARLRAFLKELLANHHKVGKLTYTNKEMTGEMIDDRTSIADIICQDSNMQNIMLEMQAANRKNFISRSVYYLSCFVSTLGEKGKWNYDFQPTTMVNIVDFDIPDDDIDTDYVEYYRFAKERNNHSLSNKILIVYVNLRRFNKRLEELETLLDKWLFLLKNLSDLEEMPAIFDTPLFRKLFHDAEFAKLKNNDKMKYTKEMKAIWDKNAELEFAKDEGKAEIRRDFVRALLHEPGYTPEKIAKMVKVPLALVEKIIKEEEVHA